MPTLPRSPGSSPRSRCRRWCSACPCSPPAQRRVYGAAYGLLPIGWIILNAVFLYNLTVETGQFEVVKNSVSRLSADRRIQALLVAFSFGAFIEGASGFGTPVAICSALLIGLGFTPLYAAGLSLIANTAPVAFGAIGTPILTLAAVTGIPAQTLGVMAGRQLPFVSLIVPAWLVVTMSGWRGLRGVWPAVLVCGGTFAIVQFAWSNYVGVELVDIVGGLASIAALALFSRVWQPRDVWEFPEAAAVTASAAGRLVTPSAAPPRRRASQPARARGAVLRAWMPWLFLSVAVILWGLTPVKVLLNGGPAGLFAYRARRRSRRQPCAVARVGRAAAASRGVPRISGRAGGGGPRENRRAGLPEREGGSGSVHAQLGVSDGHRILLAALATALYFRLRSRCCFESPG